uniref:Endosome-associated-trafficking regulator 1 n=1 Tax=Anas platyrhynchos platyrhynchos TaxID=8840 RepID=A0A493TID5_ANAPP
MRKEKLGGEEGGDRVHHPHLIKHLEKEVLQHKLTYFNFCAGIANSDVPQAACCVLRPAVVSVIFILFQKRALKAENSAAKLKQENALLQVQLKNYKAENEALRSGQSASLAAVKQNAEAAFQNLLTVIANSRSAVRQLVSGAESLQLVADLLKSIDSISEVPEDGQ